MRLLPAMILGFVLLAAPVHSAAQPPSEAEIIVKLQELNKQKERLEAELIAAKSNPSGSIKAEVRGRLLKDETGAFYIQTRVDRGAELRVYVEAGPTSLRNVLSPDSLGMDVVAIGPLFVNVPIDPHLHGKTHGLPVHVPPHGLYMKNGSVIGPKAPPSLFPPSSTPAPSVPTIPSLPDLPTATPK